MAVGTPVYCTNVLQKFDSATGVRRHVHFPGLAIDKDISCGNFTLKRMEFDQWREIEGPSARDWSYSYGHYQVFYTTKVYNIRDWQAQVPNIIQNTDLTAVLTWSVLSNVYSSFLPSPANSVQYTEFLDDNHETVGVYRDRGFSGLANIWRPVGHLYVPERHVPFVLAHLDYMEDLKRKQMSRYYLSLVAPYYYSQRSQFRPSQFVSFVAQIENILNPAPVFPLRRKFNEAVYSIFGHDSLQDLRASLDSAYRFRSAYLHGDMVRANRIRESSDWSKTALPFDLLHSLFDGLCRVARHATEDDLKKPLAEIIADRDLMLTKGGSEPSTVATLTSSPPSQGDSSHDHFAWGTHWAGGLQAPPMKFESDQKVFVMNRMDFWAEFDYHTVFRSPMAMEGSDHGER